MNSFLEDDKMKAEYKIICYCELLGCSIYSKLLLNIPKVNIKSKEMDAIKKISKDGLDKYKIFKM